MPSPSVVLKQAVRLFLHRSDGTILVVTRAHRHGVYCMPGGKVDDIDNGSLEAAVCRELKEETGLKLDSSALSILFSATARDDKGDTSKDFEVTTFCTPWLPEMGTPYSVESGVYPSWVWPETLLNYNMGGDYEAGVIAAWGKRNIPLLLPKPAVSRFSVS